MIRFESVDHQYGQTPSLQSIDFHVDAGEFVFLTGQTGAGKSTLLRLILGTEHCSKGIVQVLGKDLSTLRKKEIPFHLRRIGTVFQDFKLLPTRSVFDNIALVLRLHGVLPSFLEPAVRKALEQVGLAKHLHRKVQTLSGGEQQRVAIARAIVHSPPLILADEPTGNLDPVTAAETMHLFLDIQERGSTVLVVTHNLELVRLMRQRVLTLERGRLVEDHPNPLRHL